MAFGNTNWFENLQQGEGHRSIIYPAEAIPQMGFGKELRMEEMPNGFVTVTFDRSFRMSCGHIINSPVDCAGDACFLCVRDIQLLMEQTGRELRPEIVHYMATPCRVDLFHCQRQYCSAPVCRRHVGLMNGRIPLCPEHFHEYTNLIEKEKRGAFTFNLRKFVRSLFLPSEEEPPKRDE